MVFVASFFRPTVAVGERVFFGVNRGWFLFENLARLDLDGEGVIEDTFDFIVVRCTFSEDDEGPSRF